MYKSNQTILVVSNPLQFLVKPDIAKESLPSFFCMTSTLLLNRDTSLTQTHTRQVLLQSPDSCNVGVQNMSLSVSYYK